MKILHVCPDYYPFSKGAMSFKLLSESWRNQGHTVTVISSTPQNKRKKFRSIVQSETAFVKLYKLPSRFSEAEYYSPIECKDLIIIKKFCKSELPGYDIIFVEGLLESLPRLLLKGLKKFEMQGKTVFINHGLPEATYDGLLSNLSSVFHKTYGRILAKNVEKFVVYSDYTKRQLKTILKVPETKMVKIKLGIDVDTFLNYANSYMHTVPHSLSNKQTDYILAIGRYDKIKGYDILLKAFGLVVKEFVNIKLIIAGSETEYTGSLKNLASELGIKHRVDFLGRVGEEDKVQMMLKSRVFVVPSLREGYGLNVIEASILGLQIVATDVGAHSEILRDYNSKILVNANSVDSLYSGLIRMLKSKAQNTGIHVDIAQLYNIKKTAEELLNLALSLKS